jgi:hypothetical protein
MKEKVFFSIFAISLILGLVIGNCETQDPTQVDPEILFNFVYSFPAHTETDVARNRKILLGFNKSIDATSVEANVSLDKKTGNSYNPYEFWAYQVDNQAFSITLWATDAAGEKIDLDHTKDHRVRILSGLMAESGETLGKTVDIEFTLSGALDVSNPIATTSEPQDGEVGQTIDSIPTVFFSEDLDPATVTADNIIVTDSSGNPVAGNVFYSAISQTISFFPVELFNYLETYTIEIGQGITDLAGNPLESIFHFSFTTGDNTPPAVVLDWEETFANIGDIIVLPGSATDPDPGDDQLIYNWVQVTGEPTLEISENNTATAGDAVIYFVAPTGVDNYYMFRLDVTDSQGTTASSNDLYIYPNDAGVIPAIVSPGSYVWDATDFDWSDVTGAAEYEIVFSVNPDLSDPYYTVVVSSSDISVLLTDLNINMYAYWGVQAISNTGVTSSVSAIGVDCFSCFVFDDAGTTFDTAIFAP